MRRFDLQCSEIEDVSEIFEGITFGLDDGFDMVGPVVSAKFEHRGSPYLILICFYLV